MFVLYSVILISINLLSDNKNTFKLNYSNDYQKLTWGNPNPLPPFPVPPPD